jgi:competence ComEA-like helix-hairpin-helix protein
MARISLRAYNRDIEAMIDGGQIDEAFAHCRYILERYPKHIDTYRLMGKALLEAQRFGDASDVFHRVLSSVPDDFIAHLGMSIIREDESNLDAAIWHMERSFEVQPSNAAVQVELRRLYGLRDGLTPQKIQLTRGALARMSAKSNLFTQAIAELRTALSNDPQRPDLLVVLAEMYAQTGARMEAVETCNSLISKLPYCLAANRILSEILPETEHAERAREYKERLAELDPYYAQLSPVAPTIDQVPDGAVTIERYDYPGESLDAIKTVQPEWATALGVNIDEELESEEETLDWLKDEDQVSTESIPIPEDDLESEKQLLTEELAGDDSELISPEPDEEEQLPDWMLKTDQPEDEEITDLPVSETQEPEIERVDELSEGSLPPTTDVSPEVKSEQLPDGSQEAEPLPDWMREAEQLEEPEIITDQASEGVEPALEVESEPIPSEPSEEEQLPDWVGETAESADIETPDWLHEVMAESSEEDTDLPGVAGVAAAAGMSAILSDDDQEPETKDQDRSEITDDEDILTAEDDQVEIEEFVSEVDEEPADADIPVEGVAAGGGSLEAAGIAAGAAMATAALGGNKEDAEEYEVDSETEASSFEESLPESDLPLDKELPLEDSAPVSDPDIPDWLQDLGEDLPIETDSPEEPVLQDELDESEEQITPVPVPEPESEEPAPILDIDEFPLEVDEIASDNIDAFGIGEGQTTTEFTDTIPDWLSEVSPEEVPDLGMEDAAADEEIQGIVQAEIPDWLHKMEQEHLAELAAAGEVERVEELEFDSDVTELAGEDVPSWLMTAMETELPSETVETSEIEDIGEILSEEEIEEGFAAEEEISPEPLEEEELLPEIEAEVDLAAAAIAEETVSEIEEKEPIEVELESEERVLDKKAAEEVDEETIGEVVLPEPGVGIPALAAAGLIADEMLEEGDTQPISVREQAEPAEGEPEEGEVEDIAPIVSEYEAAEELEPAEADLDEPAVQPEVEQGEQPVIAEIEEPPPPDITEEGPTTEIDEDEAMAWLESLAAKQGVAEEELLTSPDERLEEPPEWIQEIAEQDEVFEEAEQEEKIDALEAAALAGVSAGALISEEEESEQVELPDDETALPVETTSEWVPEITAEIDAGPEPELDEPPLVVAEEPEIAEPADEMLEPEAAEIPPAEIVEVEDAEEEVTPIEEQLIEEPAEEEHPVDIPEWLSDLGGEEELQVEAPSTEWSPAMLAEEGIVPEIDEKPLEAKINLNAASLSQLEKIPGIGFIHAQRIVNYRNESGSFKELNELEKVPGLSSEMVDDLKDYLTVEVVVEAAPPPSSHPELQDAWNSINEGEIDKAVNQYTQLINRDELLDEVIRDLQEALGKYPHDASLYQSLGDAYMHSDMLQEALDAYNRAEDLIK